MSSDLDSVIKAEHDLIAYKYYAVASCTVLVYDHSLMFADEVRYAWSGKKSWAFWLFIVNRYLPITWMVLMFVVVYAPQTRITPEVCEKAMLYSAVVFFTDILAAQVVLTLRTYAVTMKNTPITMGFVAISVAQLALAIYIVISIAKVGAQLESPIILEMYHTCEAPQGDSPIFVAYSSLSLLYDFLAFSLVVFSARRLRGPGPKLSTILETIADDTTRYFLVLLVSHFILVLTMRLGGGITQFLSGVGVVVCLPVMISRMMLSLWKAVDPSYGSSVLTERRTRSSALHSMAFASPPQTGQDLEEDCDTSRYAS